MTRTLLRHIRPVSLFTVAFSFSLVTSISHAAISGVDVVPAETANGSAQLTPGFIGGTIDLGGQNINYIDLKAVAADDQARITPTSEGPYSITVNVPADSSAEYTVQGMAYMDSYNTRLYLKDRKVTVEAGKTAQLDVIVEPGYVNAEIVTNGCTLASSEVWAVLETDSTHSKAYSRHGSEQTFRFPVQPNPGVTVYGQAQLASGQTTTLAAQSVDFAPGEDTIISWEIPCTAGQLGAIQHDVDYHMAMDSHLTYLYNQGAWTPYRTVRHDGSTSFADLAPGDWRLYTYSYWNDNHNLIARNLENIGVLGGQTTQVGIDEVPGSLQGTFTLSGTKSIQDTSIAYIYAYGQNPLYSSYNTTSRALIDNSAGAFNLALPRGEWQVYTSFFHFYTNTPEGEFLNSRLYLYDYSLRSEALFANSGETVSGHDLAYETGSATISYSRSDGGDFQSPFLYATCYNRDESGRVLSYVYSNSYGAADAHTVTFVGVPGTYEVEPWAWIGGSRTTFGKITVEIVGGVDKVVDIGGPQLVVSSPEPGSVTTSEQVVVAGTATDDQQVVAISVNGGQVDFVSTNNPDDPNEVAFRVEVVLAEGENLIETTATDAAGNESSDSRSVVREIPVPEPGPEPEPEPVSLVGDIDIKPGSCSNPYNIRSEGVLPVVVRGAADFPVAAIDPSSLTIFGVPALRSAVEDVASPPQDGWLLSEDEACGLDLGDGFDDLSLKFDTRLMVEALGDVADGDVVTLTLSGTLYDGTGFSGQDIVTILDRGKSRSRVSKTSQPASDSSAAPVSSASSVTTAFISTSAAAQPAGAAAPQASSSSGSAGQGQQAEASVASDPAAPQEEVGRNRGGKEGSKEKSKGRR